MVDIMIPRADPVISVIVPVWNGARDLGRLLSALQRQDAIESSFETIVVDNGSTDDTVAVAKAAGIAKLLHEPDPGSYRARNRGIAEARGEWLLFTDADCIPAENWISSALLATREKPGFGVLGGDVVLFSEDGSPAIELFERLTSLNQKAYVANGHCITANWLCRKSTLAAVGGFDAKLLSGGDMECSKRIAALGEAIEYDERLVVYHPTRATLTELVRKRRRVVGGVWARRNGGLRTLASINFNFAKWWMALIWRIAFSDPPISVRLCAVGVASSLYAVSVGETLRLFLGAQPYRS